MTESASLPVKIGIIGGSGLGDALGAEAGRTVQVDTPFGQPSGPITLADWETSGGGIEIHILQRHGIGHTLNPSAVPYRANIYALKSLGVTHILASGATGSLREEIAPGSLVIVDQLIDKTCKRANTFYEHAAVHVEFSQPFCPVMRKWLLEAAKRMDTVRVHQQGTYIAMEGPAFSTEAESHMHRSAGFGGDLIGMTACPEAKLAREAEIAYALIAMPTDYDCWKPRETTGDDSPQNLLEEIIGNLQKATQANITLMKEALRDTTMLASEPSPAHSALALGIWSDKSKLDPAEVKRLDVLWGKYF